MDWNKYPTDYPQLDDSNILPPLLQRVLGGASGSLLDVGCGEGALLTRIRNAHGETWDLTGFEVSILRGRVAEQRAHRVVVDSSGQVPLLPRSFDLVISCHLIEHVPDDRAHAAELAQLARPGFVYVETPVKLRGAWYFRRNIQAGWVLDPTHVREYRSAGQVCAVLSSVGLEVLAEDLTNLAFPVAAAELLVRRVVGAPRRPGRPAGLGAKKVPIPRYRQQAVLARRPPGHLSGPGAGMWSSLGKQPG